MILVNASNLKKTFGEDVLFSDIGFSVDSKDKIGFVGINGAGKSTLFKIITGEMKPDDGEVFINKNTKIGTGGNTEKNKHGRYLRHIDKASADAYGAFFRRGRLLL